jgi:methionine--tRNA ligase beta chain
MENINFEEFKKIHLRIAKIVSAEKIEESEKLLKLEVDLGDKERQIIAGIGKFYQPEELIGREIVVIINLEPRTLMGLESQGMLLAANNEGEPVLLRPDKEVPAGTEIR